MNSYYKCASGGRTVTVWPSITVEAGFYDVVVTADDCANVRRIHRVTVDEAAAVVVTELGAPLGTTCDALAGMIRRWREEYAAFVALTSDEPCYCRRCYLHDEPGGCVAVD
jgi:hypothetical protein